MECLKGSPIVDWTKSDLGVKKEQYDFIANSIPDFGQKYTLGEFLDATKAVESRTFEFALNE